MITYYIKDNDTGEIVHAMTAYNEYKRQLIADYTADGAADLIPDESDIIQLFELWYNDMAVYNTVSIREVWEYFQRPDSIDFDLG